MEIPFTSSIAMKYEKSRREVYRTEEKIIFVYYNEMFSLSWIGDNKNVETLWFKKCHLTQNGEDVDSIEEICDIISCSIIGKGFYITLTDGFSKYEVISKKKPKRIKGYVDIDKYRLVTMIENFSHLNDF